MGFGQAISYNFSNLGNFDGRAARPEFWWWVLFLWIINLVINMFTGGIGVFMGGQAEFGFLTFVGYVIWAIIILATIAVGARRLHDTGRSGWWQLLWLLPCIGPIVLIVFWASAGNPGDNQYGPVPAT